MDMELAKTDQFTGSEVRDGSTLQGSAIGYVQEQLKDDVTRASVKERDMQ